VIDLRKSFGALEVLRGVSFDVHRGNVLSIIGASGSGKSTLLRCINHLETPTSGDVLIEGESLVYRNGGNGARTPRPLGEINRMRRELGMVFQQFNLWPHMTALENVVRPQIVVLKRPRREAEARARKLLARLALADRADSYPHALSGGQKQRTLIARALVGEPTILILDEPTNGMDLVSTTQILSLVRDLHEREGRTVLMVSHALNEIANYVNRIALTLEGAFRIGSVDEIVNEQTLTSMYGIPVEVNAFDGHRIVLARRLSTAEYKIGERRPA
jgi:ABC-type histidine transport system ATPase subunit